MATEPQRGSQSEHDAPISDQFPFPEILRDIQKEWNKAESAIKRSEQIVKDLSVPAISELRYAGRRIVDALDSASHGGSEERIKALLEDARFCCHRAQHDAIDAAMAKIGIDIENLTSKLSFEAVIHVYPKFRDFYTSFAVARKKIVATRENRDDRNGIYEAITAVDLPALVDGYDELMAVRPLIKSTSLKLKLGSSVGLIVSICAILTAAFAGLAVDWSKYFGHSPSAAPAQIERRDQPKKEATAQPAKVDRTPAPQSTRRVPSSPTP